MAIEKVAPQWIVKDVEESIDFYTEKLGFRVDWLGENPLFAIISRERFTLMLRQLKQPNLTRPNRIPFVEAGWHSQAAGAWDAYIWVENADSLYTEFEEKGVSIIRPLKDMEYGNRDFEIEDCNGYILCFGHQLA